jgi:hypothetical protein
VLQGEFAVRHVDGNRVLELPGAPLDSMGMVLGPPRREDVRMTARILGERRGGPSTIPIESSGAPGNSSTRLPSTCRTANSPWSTITPSGSSPISTSSKVLDQSVAVAEAKRADAASHPITAHAVHPRSDMSRILHGG